MTPEERFWAKVQAPDENGCLNWRGAKTLNGYGQFWVDGRRVLAHRFAYELLVGPIPKGLTIDHLCRNRGCENVLHLEVVTNRANTLRGEGVTALNAAKTHCLRAHSFDERNTYRRPSSGGRMCRACQIALQRERRRRRLEVEMQLWS